MKRKGIIHSAAAGMALLLLGALTTETVNKFYTEPRTVSSWGDLFDEYLDFREMYGPIVPPSVSYEDVAVRMNAGDFSFLAEMWSFRFRGETRYVAEESALAKLDLPLTLMIYEDLQRGEIVILSSSDGEKYQGEALFDAPEFMPCEKDFPRERYLYKELAPRRVVWEITLKPEADAWAELLGTKSAPTSEMFNLPSEIASEGCVMGGPPPGYTNDLYVGGTPASNGLDVIVYAAEGFTNRVELYICPDLISNIWTVAAENLYPVYTNPAVWWYSMEEDAGFFIAGNMDIDSDTDNICDAREIYVHKTDPDDADSDNDELPDGWEILHGLDPHADDAFYDPDGDHIPNLYEYMHGTDPTNALSIPPNITVVTVNGAGGTYSNIQSAVTNAAASNAYPIVRIEPGTYTGAGNRDITLSVSNILIYGTNAATVIDCEQKGRAFEILSGCPVISGLVMQNGRKAYGGAIYAWNENPWIINCVFRKNTAFQQDGGAFLGWGGGTIENCTFIENHADDDGGAVYGIATLRNCLVWNNTAGSHDPQIDDNAAVSYSCVEGGFEGVGNTSNDPVLVYNSWRLGSTNSSCYRNGNPTNAWLIDIDGEMRKSALDMGADEFIDNDDDGLPDWWERTWFTNLSETATNNLDSDMLNNLEEYLQGTDPWLGDTDGDGASDYVESALYNTNWPGSDPLDADTDDDGMRDDYEYNHGLNPTNALDAFYDPDGDRIPNLYEYGNGQWSPTNTPTKPEPHVTVSTNGHNGTYTNIQTAVNDAAASNAYPIVLIEAGTYTGTGNRDITLNMTNILIYGTNAQTVIDCQTSGRAFYIISGRPVISGLVMRNGYMPYDSGGAVYVTDGKPRLINCVFWNNQAHSGGALKDYSGAILEGCTLVSNYADNDGGAVDGWSTTLRNCLVWNNRAPNYPQLRINSAGSVFYSCVEGWNEDNGNTTNDPVLVYNSWRIASTNSSCVGAGDVTNAPLMDIAGAVRGEQIDIGAEEVIDLDADGMSDWWETHYGVNDPNADEDGDGLSNLQECLTGTDPFDGDSDNDGLGDYEESEAYNENWTGTHPLNPDTDGDLMPDGYEYHHGLNPSDEQDAYYDPDGDHIPSLYEYMHGTIPTNAASIPTNVATAAANGPDGAYSNIVNAITNASALSTYPIIRLEPGTYALSTPNGAGIILTNNDILIYGTNAQTVIDCEEKGRAFSFFTGRPVFSGLTFHRGYAVELGGAVYAANADPFFRNCVFQNNEAGLYGGAIYVHSGNASLENCTLVNNKTDWGAYRYGSAIYGNESTDVKNCLIWGNRGADQVFPFTMKLSYSCVEDWSWEGTGMITNDPDLAAGSWRVASTDSSCWRAGVSSNAPLIDIDGESRIGGVDIGADQAIDTDGDGLTDWFELNRVPPTNPADPDSDNDGLTDYEEIYLYQTDPLDADSDDDGLEDDEEIAQQTDPWDSDSDDDGLSDGDEVNQHGTDPLLADGDEDGLSDYEEVILYGSNPSVHDSMLDGDDDGILDILDSSPANPDMPVQGSCVITISYPQENQILN